MEAQQGASFRRYFRSREWKGSERVGPFRPVRDQAVHERQRWMDGMDHFRGEYKTIKKYLYSFNYT